MEISLNTFNAYNVTALCIVFIAFLWTIKHIIEKRKNLKELLKILGLDEKELMKAEGIGSNWQQTVNFFKTLCDNERKKANRLLFLTSPLANAISKLPEDHFYFNVSLHGRRCGTI